MIKDQWSLMVRTVTKIKIQSTTTTSTTTTIRKQEQPEKKPWEGKPLNNVALPS
jgi:hypothetical protein